MSPQTDLAERWRNHYRLWWFFMPPLVFFATFTGLCAIECTAMPWYTFLLAPAVILVIGIILFTRYWSLSAQLPDGIERGSLRRFLLWSFLWAPFVALLGILVATQLVATISATIGRSY